MELGDNVLRIGISSLEEIEEKIKAFRSMNLNAKNKRYLIARENIYDAQKKLLIQKASDIDIVKAKLLRRSFKGDHSFKTFQPDEGIVLISNMSSKGGLSFSVDLVTQVMNIGRGSYEAFIDRVDGLSQMYRLFQKSLFPKLVVIGYLSSENPIQQKALFDVITKTDPYIRFLEVVHTKFKPQSVFPRMPQVEIMLGDPDAWKRFILEIIREYTKPYLIEDQ